MVNRVARRLEDPGLMATVQGKKSFQIPIQYCIYGLVPAYLIIVYLLLVCFYVLIMPVKRCPL